MTIRYKGLEFQVNKDAIIPCIDRDMTDYNRSNPQQQFKTYHFTQPGQEEAGWVALQVIKKPRIIWIHDIEVDEDTIPTREGYGSLFLHHSLTQLDNVDKYTVRVSGKTNDGKNFFRHYNALPSIAYEEFIKKLSRKLMSISPSLCIPSTAPESVSRT